MSLASLWAVAVMALGDPRWAFFRRRKAPRALSERCSALAARRRAAAARLALGHFVMSVPISLTTFRAVYASTPSIRVRSTPVIRYSWRWASKRGAFF